MIKNITINILSNHVLLVSSHADELLPAMHSVQIFIQANNQITDASYPSSRRFYSLLTRVKQIYQHVYELHWKNKVKSRTAHISLRRSERPHLHRDFYWVGGVVSDVLRQRIYLPCKFLSKCFLYFL